MPRELTLPHSRRLRAVTIPSFFYGTAWKEQQTQALTRQAIACGFRAIDTANQRKHYFEAAVGEAIAQAIAEGKVARADLFLQTKFTYARGQDHRLPYDASVDAATQVQQSFASSLDHLGVDYIDSYVLHGPESSRGISRVDWEVWRTMEGLQQAGNVRFLGASNVSLSQLMALEKDALIKPAFVQNRCYARDGWDREVRAFCLQHDIVYQGFSLLTANARELSQRPIHEIVQRAQMTLPQVVFRFALAVGMIPLTGTSNEAHMREDLSSFDLELSTQDIQTIERIAG